VNIVLDENFSSILKRVFDYEFGNASESDAIKHLLVTSLKQQAAEGFDGDWLTCAKSYYAFMKYIKSTGLKQGHRFTVINVVGMKRQNDLYGFTEGDKYLQAVTETIMARMTAPLYRIGGDRFYTDGQILENKVFACRGRYELISMICKKEIIETDYMFIHAETAIDLILNASVKEENEYFAVNGRSMESSLKIMVNSEN